MCQVTYSRKLLHANYFHGGKTVLSPLKSQLVRANGSLEQPEILLENYAWKGSTLLEHPVLGGPP